MYFKSKKAITWEQLVLAIIAIVVVVLVILWFSRGGEKPFNFAENKTGEVGLDSDHDGVPDIIDACPNDNLDNLVPSEKLDSKGCHVQK